MQDLLHVFLLKSMLVIFFGEVLYIKWSVRECKNILLVVTYDIKWRFFYRFYDISILWNLYLSGQPDFSGQSAIPR